MSSFTKGLLIGGAAGIVLAGIFVPFGETNESIYDKFLKKEDK